eukprot:1158225-Pelagomonas_calceolata.AAC.7
MALILITISSQDGAPTSKEVSMHSLLSFMLPCFNAHLHLNKEARKDFGTAAFHAQFCLRLLGRITCQIKVAAPIEVQIKCSVSSSNHPYSLTKGSPLQESREYESQQSLQREVATQTQIIGVPRGLMHFMKACAVHHPALHFHLQGEVATQTQIIGVPGGLLHVMKASMLTSVFSFWTVAMRRSVSATVLQKA